MKTKRPNRRAHLVFSIGLVIVLLAGLVPRMASGEPFFQAVWGALTDVRPGEWLMFFVFWYALTKNILRDGWFRPPQSLGLADQNRG